MATITIDTGAAGPAQRILDAFATAYNYTGFLADGTTPETKAQFAKRQIIRFIKETVNSVEATSAGNTARATALAAADTAVNPT